MTNKESVVAAFPLCSTTDDRVGAGRKRRTPTPAREDFGVIAAAIRGIPADKRLAAKEAARRLVNRDDRQTRSSLALFSVLLDWINWAEGKDWHGNRAFADACGITDRSVRRAMSLLVTTGHIIRRTERSRYGDFEAAETTLPTLAKAALGEELDSDSPVRGYGQEKHLGTDRTVRGGTDKPVLQTLEAVTNKFNPLPPKPPVPGDDILQTEILHDFSSRVSPTGSGGPRPRPRAPRTVDGLINVLVQEKGYRADEVDFLRPLLATGFPKGVDTVTFAEELLRSTCGTPSGVLMAAAVDIRDRFGDCPSIAGIRKGILDFERAMCNRAKAKERLRDLQQQWQGDAASAVASVDAEHRCDFEDWLCGKPSSSPWLWASALDEYDKLTKELQAGPPTFESIGVDWSAPRSKESYAHKPKRAPQ